MSNAKATAYAEAAEAVDPNVFREIMSGFPAGVTVVTAYDEHHSPYGLTVSAFCSVSTSPPLVLVCLDDSSDTLPAIWNAGAFTVNFLGANHEELAVRFASKGSEKFSGLSYQAPADQRAGPILQEECSAHVVCQTQQAIAAGDHWILVGQVIEGHTSENVPPLIYGERTFAGWNQLVEGDRDRGGSGERGTR